MVLAFPIIGPRRSGLRPEKPQPIGGWLGTVGAGELGVKPQRERDTLPATTIQTIILVLLRAVVPARDRGRIAGKAAVRTVVSDDRPAAGTCGSRRARTSLWGLGVPLLSRLRGNRQPVRVPVDPLTRQRTWICLILQPQAWRRRPRDEGRRHD